MNPFYHLMIQGPRGRIARPPLTIQKAYITSTGTISGPAGWTAVRNSTGYYTVDVGVDATADGVAPWAFVHYSGGSNSFTCTAQIQLSAANPSEVEIWTPRVSDGGETNSNFYFYLATGTADSVKKAILLDTGSFASTPFSAPAGWTSSRLGTGNYRVTPTGGLDLRPINGEAAFMVMPYGIANPDGPKQHAEWNPDTVTTEARINTRRLTDDAIQDRDSYMVWIDPSVHEIPVIGAEANGGSFIGGTPVGWTINNPTAGLAEVGIAQGNQPVFPVQDGLGLMLNCRTGQTNGAGISATFDNSPEVNCRTFRILDGAATYNKTFFITTILGSPPA